MKTSCGKFLNLAYYFPYDVKLRLLAHSRSFIANQKARNAIVGAENLLIKDSRSPNMTLTKCRVVICGNTVQFLFYFIVSTCDNVNFLLTLFQVCLPGLGKTWT